MTETPHYNDNDRLTEVEFAKAVGCCRATLVKLRKEGRIPFCRLGRNVFYLGRHINEYFAALEENKIPKNIHLKPNAAMNAAR